MTRPVLRAFSLTLLALLLCGGFPARAAEHPGDLRQVLERREACDHWRGEAGRDKERQRDIDRGVCRTCSGTDAELAKLKKKHKANPAVMDVLDELEETIEHPDRAAAKRFCRDLRQPIRR